MKIQIYWLCFVSLLICACSNAKKSSDIQADIQTDVIEDDSSAFINYDSIYKQQFVDSLLSVVVWENSDSHIGYLGLNGRIRKIEYTIDGSGFDLPFETIYFDENGLIISVISHKYFYDYIIVDDKLSKIIRLGVDGAGLGMEFNMIREDRKSIFERYDDMGSVKYIFNRSSNNEISELEIVYRFCIDMDSDESEESHEVFKAGVNSLDSLNNWTSLTFYGDNEKTTITRKITYLDAPSYITYFESNSGDKVLAKYTNEYNNFNLRIYDCTTKRWQSLIPPPYEYEVFGYKDYKLVDNRLYLIFSTGACGALASNLECAVYCYDIETEKWEEIGDCGYGCEIVGNKIKMPFYDYENDMNYEKWYEMK